MESTHLLSNNVWDSVKLSTINPHFKLKKIRSKSNFKSPLRCPCAKFGTWNRIPDKWSIWFKTFVYFQVSSSVQPNRSWFKSQSLVRTCPQSRETFVKETGWMLFCLRVFLGVCSPYKAPFFIKHCDFLSRSPPITSCFSSGTKQQWWLDKRQTVKHLKEEDSSWTTSWLIVIEGPPRTLLQQETQDIRSNPHLQTIDSVALSLTQHTKLVKEKSRNERNLFQLPFRMLLSELCGKSGTWKRFVKTAFQYLHSWQNIPKISSNIKTKAEVLHPRW